MAVRSLAFKWIRIIFRCWHDRKPYDEEARLLSYDKVSARIKELLTVSDLEILSLDTSENKAKALMRPVALTNNTFQMRRIAGSKGAGRAMIGAGPRRRPRAPQRRFGVRQYARNPCHYLTNETTTLSLFNNI
jgi:hypothetical protein